MAREINLEHITKIEGHAKLRLKVEGGEVEEVEMEVFEGARYFEGIVKGRRYQEAAPLTSRICGVCSVVHFLTGLKAVEAGLGIKPSEAAQDLRELMHIGGVLQSHMLHVYFLALPDYLGFPDALAMASKYPQEVRMGIGLKKTGNELISVIGGREVHPISARLGGFTRLPSKADLYFLKEQLVARRQDATKTAQLFAGLDYPEFERNTQYLALSEPEKYALLSGRLTSSSAESILPDDYAKHLDEYVNPYSTSKFVTLEGKSYMTGAMARVNLNRAKLSGNAKQALEYAEGKGKRFPSCNPFYNNLAQAIESVHLLDRAIQLCDETDLSGEKIIDLRQEFPLAGDVRGVSVSEAPRGLLFHDYSVAKDGKITAANIITPTAQNLRNIEDDVRAYVPQLLETGADEKKIVSEMEKLVRAYDPCISCATHFLQVDLQIDGKRHKNR